MTLLDHLRESIDVLSVHPRRVIASGMGVFWGAAAIVLMLAWGSGFREYMREELSRYGQACVFVMPGVTSSGFFGYRSGVHVRFSRRDAAVAERMSHEEVEAIIAEHLSDERVLAEARGQVRRLDLTATDERFAAYRSFAVAYGRSLETSDIAQRRAVAILGFEAAEVLFGNAPDALGQTLRLNGRPFEVIGVAARKGRQYFNTNRPDDRLLIVPITTAETMLGYDERNVSRLNLYPRPGVDPQQALRSLLATLGPRVGFHADDVDAVRWFDISQPSKISELFYVGFMIFIGVSGTVTLLIGAIGIANYQLATLAERTVEIGVARAIGARARTIVVQTVVDSLVVSGGTALLGVLLGLAGCLALATLPPPGMFPTPVISVPAVVVTGVATLAVAVIAALVPALRVRRMDVATALRAGT
jgi:putative ABC transport system permease protein